MRRASTLFATLVFATVALPAFAQVESIQRSGQSIGTPPPVKRQVEPSTNVDVDTSGIWYHVRREDKASAQTELDRLRTENPRWSVPRDLASAIENIGRPTAAAPTDRYGLRVNAAEAAVRAGKNSPRELSSLSDEARRRKDSNGAERIGRALLDTGAPAPAREWLQRAFDWAKAGSPQQAAAANSLVKAEAALGRWDDAGKRVAALSGDARMQAAQILGNSAGVAAEQAAKSKDWTATERLARIAEANGVSRVRTDLGWVALDAGEGARAAAAFAAGPQTEESRYGLILALARPDGDLEALTKACAPLDRSTRATIACGDAFAARALAAYEAKAWQVVIDLDARADKLDLRRGGTRLLTGWSYFRQRDYTNALKAFDEASLTEPDAADGIAQSLIASGRVGELEARAGAGDARLLAAYRAQMGPLALIRQRPLLARTLEAPGTTGIDAPQAFVGAIARDKTGSSGADRIAWQGASVAASTVLGAQRFSLGVDYGRLRIGAPAPFTQVGSARPSAVAPLRAATLAMPWARWDKEAVDAAYTVNVGTTPIGGAVGAVPVAAISAERNWSNLIGSVSLRAAPRYDSLLAMAGQRDGATGTTWGRVVEIGPQAGLIYLVNENVSLSVSAAGSVLRGRGVADNSHIAATASLTYELAVPGFDYVRIGPAYGFDHYRRNQFFFTLGNGGYYSPDQSHSIGGFIDFMTQQGRGWLLGGRLTAALQHSRESAAPRFPLADDVTRFNGITQSQFGTDSVVRGAALVSPHVILGAYGRVTYAPSGRDMAGGLSVSFPFGGRVGLFASDLPRFADRSWP